MLFRVHVLDIRHDQIQIRQQGSDGLPGKTQVAFDGGGNVFLPAGGQQLPGKFGLHEDLSPGERHAPAGAGVEGGVIADLFHTCRGGQLLPDLFQRPGGTACGALKAKAAFFPVQQVGILPAVGPAGADLLAKPAADAAGAVPFQLRRGKKPLGIVAPIAVQVAALEEYDGSDPGTVRR